jgi:predicted hydrolase (HD superfamily)
MISREEAFDWLKEEIKEPNLLKHCLATEAAMKSLALRFGEDESLKWSTKMFNIF